MFNKLRRHKLIIQFLEYLVGGSIWFWSGLAFFALFYSVFHIGWVWSKILSDIIGWTLNYILQRYWAFDSNQLKGKDKSVVTRYIGLAVINTIIDYAIIGSLKHFGISPYIGQFVSAAFFTGWNYFWYRFWVFR